jgi:hypothetical protein
MSQEQVSSQRSKGAGAAAIASPPSLPDVNAQTYPFEYVQYLLDQTADFNIFAVPDPQHAEAATLTPDDPSDYFGLNGGYGMSLRCRLHHFDSLISPDADTGLLVTEAVGESSGTFSCRCFFSPDNFTWSPGRLPPPVIYDPWRSQRFVMLSPEFSFGGGDSFQGYGIGRTFPATVNGRPEVLVGGVGNIMDGFGKLSGLNGTFVLTGTLTSPLGFVGNITCRVVDPYGYINGDREVSSLTAIQDPDPASTFALLRGQKQDKSVKTTYGPSPGGGLVSLITPSQMRAIQCSFSSRGGGGVHTERRVGQVVGSMDAEVFFDLLAPPGTAQAPVPFTTREHYRFIDREGQIAGTITAAVVEGISFDLKFPGAPGQAGVRFAGFGPITGGTGPFEGIQGMLTVNSLIGIAPHALSLVHVLHILDPDGKFRRTSRAD